MVGHLLTLANPKTHKTDPEKALRYIVQTQWIVNKQMGAFRKMLVKSNTDKATRRQWQRNGIPVQLTNDKMTDEIQKYWSAYQECKRLVSRMNEIMLIYSALE